MLTEGRTALNSGELTPLFNAVSDQNGRYNQVSTIRDSQFRSVAREGITDEQIDTMTEIFRSTISVQYEDLAIRALSAACEVARMQNDEAEVSALIQPDVDKICENAEKAAVLSPTKQEAISRLRDSKVAVLTEEGLDLIRQEKNRLQDTCDEADSICDLHSIAWPYPRTMRPEDINALYEMVKSDTIVIEDIIPVTPEERMHQASIVEKAKRVIDNPEASTLTAYYLSEYVNSTVTVEDLIRFLYAVDERAVKDLDYRSRVTTILGPQLKSQKIQEELLEASGQPLQLQYGWRLLKKWDGAKWSTIRRTRIYRAFDEEALSGESERILDDTTAAYDQWTDINIPIDIPDLEEPTDEDLVEAVEPFVRMTIHAEQTAIQTETDWSIKFHQDVENAIDQLIVNDLFIEDVISGGRIRVASASRSLGTERSRELLHSAGFMNQNQLKTDEMNRCQRVISLLFNSNQEIFGNRKGKKREEAIAIIESAIAARLKSISR